MMAPADEDRHFILQGVAEGFRVTNVSVHTPPSRQKNHPSVTSAKNKERVQLQIQEEIDNGRYIVCTERPHIISALGAVPKPNTEDIRLIHDASRPHGTALNDFAVSDKYTCSTVEAAAALVQPNAYMGKVDLSSAYRSVRIHPTDYKYAGLQWTYPGHHGPTYMYDTRLMFGARLSASTFNRLTQAVVRIMSRRGRAKNILVYCDDFFVTHEDKEQCREIMNELMGVLRELGFAINYKKLVGPATTITFLGVEIDSVAHTLGLPKSKMADLIAEGRRASARACMTKRELQSLCGKLSWAAQVIYGGRTHLRRILDAMNKVEKPHHKARLTREVRRDIQWWTHVAATHNGKTKILCNDPITPVCIDACLQGGGGYHAGSWYSVAYDQWPGTEHLSINYKEVLALVPAAHLWAPLWANRRVYIYSDNQAAVAIINRGAAKDSYVMNYLREIYQSSVTHNYKLKAIYYPGRLNVVADAASRLMFPNGYQRLQAALRGAFINTPATQRAINNQRASHEHCQAGQDGTSPPATGVCQEHQQNVRHAPEGVHPVLQFDAGGAGSRIHSTHMQVCGVSHREAEIQLHTPVPKHREDNAQRGGCGQPHGGRLLYNTHTARSAAPVGRRATQKGAHHAGNSAHNTEEHQHQDPDPRSGMGRRAAHVLWAPAAVERHPHSGDGFQPGFPPATGRREFQPEGGSGHVALVEDQPIQEPKARHTLPEGAAAPTVPNTGNIQCFQPHTRRATGRSGVSNGAARAPRRTASEQGTHRSPVLDHHQASYGERRHRPRGIRHPQLQKGRKLFPIQQRHPSTQHKGAGGVGVQRLHSVRHSRHNRTGAHHRRHGSGAPQSIGSNTSAHYPLPPIGSWDNNGAQKRGVAGGHAHLCNNNAPPRAGARRAAANT